MSLFIKICGLTSLEAVASCVEHGVDAVGFVFADSPRRISPHLASRLAADLPASVTTVAVFRRPSPDDIEEVLSGFAADLVQADFDSLALDSTFRTLPVYREGSARRVPGGRFLYEGAVSGIGKAVDWAMARQVAAANDMILAGGLSAANVAMAIDQVRPSGVDVSSGVESRPGLKDPRLIEEFVIAARAAAGELVNR